MIEAYALKSPEGELKPRTITDTRVGAMVNALYLDGIAVTAGWSESDIEASFLDLPWLGTIVRVEVTEEEPPIRLEDMKEGPAKEMLKGMIEAPLVSQLGTGDKLQSLADCSDKTEFRKQP